jgi:hypothetical protein
MHPSKPRILPGFAHTSARSRPEGIHKKTSKSGALAPGAQAQHLPVDHCTRLAPPLAGKLRVYRPFWSQQVPAIAAEQGNGNSHAQARDHLFGFPESCEKIPEALI